jgi:hypothetical protein
MISCARMMVLTCPGGPADIGALNRTITHLEQQVTDLRL